MRKRIILLIMVALAALVTLPADSAGARSDSVTTVTEVYTTSGSYAVVNGQARALNTDLFYAIWREPVRVVDLTPQDGTNRWKVSEAVSEWARGGVPWAMGSGKITVTEGDLSSYGSNVVGVARMAFTGTTMVDCDIVLHPNWSGLGAAEHIMAHEGGHCAGWKHVNRDTSIMYPSVGPGSYLLEPSRWDIRQTSRAYR